MSNHFVPSSSIPQALPEALPVHPPLFFQRNFGFMWWSQFLSQIADGMTKLTLLWFVYAVTGSPLQTTIIGVLQTLPPIFLGPFLGVFIDRFSKKGILISTNLLRALIIGLIPCLVSHETFTVEYLYVLVFVNAVATALITPTLYAAVPLIVEKSSLTAANALLQATMSFGVIFGPLLSGLGIALFTTQEVLCINVMTYTGSALLLSFVAIPEDISAVRHLQSFLPSYVQDLKEGIHFTFVGQSLISLLILSAGLYSFVLSAFHTLLPVFGRNMLAFGPVEVGYLTAGVGVGLFLASLGLARMPLGPRWRRLRLLGTTSLLTAAGLWGFAGMTELALSLLVVLVIGIGSGVLTPIEWGIIQEISPPHLLGRVLALYGMLAMLASIAGMTTFGWVMERFGEFPTLLGMGLVLLLNAQVAFYMSRRVRFPNQ